MAEDLIAVVRNTKHEKVALLSAAARALRDHLDKPISQFQGYFLALFSDQDYSKVLDSIAKVDKSLRAAIPSKVCSISAGIQCKGQFSPITEASIFLFVCCEFALETSSLSKSNPLYFFFLLINGLCSLYLLFRFIPWCFCPPPSPIPRSGLAAL